MPLSHRCNHRTASYNMSFMVAIGLFVWNEQEREREKWNKMYEEKTAEHWKIIRWLCYTAADLEPLLLVLHEFHWKKGWHMLAHRMNDDCWRYMKIKCENWWIKMTMFFFLLKCVCSRARTRYGLRFDSNYVASHRLDWTYWGWSHAITHYKIVLC